MKKTGEGKGKGGLQERKGNRSLKPQKLTDVRVHSKISGKGNMVLLFQHPPTRGLGSLPLGPFLPLFRKRGQGGKVTSRIFESSFREIGGFKGGRRSYKGRG